MAMDAHEHPLFIERLWWVVTSTIFVRWWRLKARMIAELLGLILAFDHSTQLVALMCWLEGPFCAFWLLASETASHNTKTRFSTPKSMTMASAGAMQGKYWPLTASSGIYGSPIPAVLGDAHHFAPTHRLGHQNDQWRRCIFCHHWFIVMHNPS